MPLHPIPSRYTCDGGNVSLPFAWRHAPANTKEIDLFVVASRDNAPVWGIAGLKPSVHGFSAGRLPAGAILGRNSSGQNGYSLCPPKGSQVNYVVRVLPLPHRLAAKPGFNVEALFGRALNTAEASGLLTFSYQRS